MKLNSTTEIDFVVSVCSASDVDVWRHASAAVVRYISASQYLVVVPDEDVDLFRKASHEKFQVLKESSFAHQWEGDLKERLADQNPSRYGWYLQQLLKISVSNQLPENCKILIWDADTIPIRNIRFFQKNGKVSYFWGVENHTPYFSNLMRLVGLPKLTEKSFIAQCFPVKSDWVHSFTELIRSFTQANTWESGVIQSIDPNELSGFSEYESIGTFILERHPEKVEFRKEKWIRRGNALLGKPQAAKNIFVRILFARFMFISFEKWDTRRLSHKELLKLWGRIIFLGKPG